MAGKANQMKWGKWNGQVAHVLGWRAIGLPTSMWNSPPYWEVPTLIMEGWHYTLQSSQTKMTEHEVVLLKDKGGYIYAPKDIPHLTMTMDSWYTYFETDSKGCTYKETSIVVKLKAFI